MIHLNKASSLRNVLRRLPSGQRREVQGLILQGFGSSNLPLRIIHETRSRPHLFAVSTTNRFSSVAIYIPSFKHFFATGYISSISVSDAMPTVIETAYLYSCYNKEFLFYFFLSQHLSTHSLRVQPSTTWNKEAVPQLTLIRTIVGIYLSLLRLSQL